GPEVTDLSVKRPRGGPGPADTDPGNSVLQRHRTPREWRWRSPDIDFGATAKRENPKPELDGFDHHVAGKDGRHEGDGRRGSWRGCLVRHTLGTMLDRS